MKILVGIPTYERERHALIPLLQGLQKQKFQNFDVVMADNTPGDAYVAILEQALHAAFKKKKTEVLHVVAGKDRFKKILKTREAIREYFLERNEYTHLFMLDSDVIVPKSALARLMVAGKDLATGIYMNSELVDERTLKVKPCVYVDEENGARRLDMAEVLRADLLEIGAAGLGCTLASRAVMEKVDFRLNEKGTGEDILFYRDAVKAGFKPFAVCKVKCLHMQFVQGDPRNTLFDASRFKLKK